jgi:transcriptional regulator with XRE-family HTH domain
MYEIFEKLLNMHNVTAYKVAKDTGIPYGSLSDWKHGRGTPKQDKLSKIADYFGVTLDYLLGRDKEMDFALSFSSDEEAEIYIEIMKSIEKINISGMKEASRYLRYLSELSEYIKKDEDK